MTLFQKTSDIRNLQKNLGLQGKVFVSFIIDRNGEVINEEIYRGLLVPQKLLDDCKNDTAKINFCKKAAYELNEEALAAVKKNT